MKRALIIGSAGQDGRLLAELLRARNIDHIGIDRRGSVSSAGELLQPGAVIDPQFLRDVVASFSPTDVFYLAAHHHSAQALPDSNDAALWKASLETQVLGLVHALEALRLHAPAGRLFYASSSRVFGTPGEQPQTEGTPLLPHCVYGMTKVTGMQACRHYRERHGIFASVGILYNHESSYRKEEFLSRKVILAASAIRGGEKKRLILGDLSSEVDWGYAPDYVDAMTRILQLDEVGDYIIATGQSHTVREFVQIAFEQQGLDYREWVDEDRTLKVRPSHRLVGDFSRLRQATGWKPTVDFPEMILLLGQ